jgi:predicted ferric reductase
MTMIQCENCQYELSDQALTCIKCGHPQYDKDSLITEKNSAWNAVTRSKTPINLFAIAMMSCAAILGMSAVTIDNDYALIAFTYTLHIFLAVTGMFFLTILFCRKAVYHPEDLAKAKKAGLEDLGNDRPILAAVLIGLMLLAYGLYQLTESDPSLLASLFSNTIIE